MATNILKTSVSTFSSAGMALLSTTCCALPITLVALGAGGAMASLATAMPWLAELSQYKGVTFSVGAVALGFSWWQMRRAGQCSIADAKRLRWQKWVLRLSTLLFLGSLFAAYALLPITLWLDRVE